MEMPLARPRPTPLPDRGRLVVMVGRIEGWKGQDVFLDAVRRLPAEIRSAHVFALVGGAVPGDSRFLEWLQSRPRNWAWLFLGEPSDVPALLRAADVSVQLSRRPILSGRRDREPARRCGHRCRRRGRVPEMISDPSIGLLASPR